jgi:hypothetical protein
MIVLRTLDGAPKWLLRDFLREEARPVQVKSLSVHLPLSPGVWIGK